MGRQNGASLPASVEDTRGRIVHWRRTRAKQGPMPEELWTEAVTAAREHGVYVIARGLGVDYASLKMRVIQAEAHEQRDSEPEPIGFVEVAPADLLGSSSPSDTEVELTAADGARLTIRGLRQDTVDVASLVAAFWRRTS